MELNYSAMQYMVAYLDQFYGLVDYYYGDCELVIKHMHLYPSVFIH